MRLVHWVGKILVLLLTVFVPCALPAGEPPAKAGAERTAIQQGYEILRTKPYLPADFDQEVFDSLWKLWPTELRREAANATQEERRRMTLSYYGLMEVPGEKDASRALGYVDDGKGGWVMNCLACHGGKVAGKVIPGLPNSHFALETLTEDVRLIKFSLRKRLSHLDGALLSMPLGTSDGTTNSVVFGIALGALRKPDMSVDESQKVPQLTHHDMDAPPLWNLSKKQRLYADGFAPKNHRVLMQFMLLPKNDRETVYAWEPDFKKILAWMDSLEPPPYPYEIDSELADRGKPLFEKNCSTCHGTYGEEESYELKTVPLEVVGTDPLRATALNVEHRQWMAKSWMSFSGRDRVDLEPAGYVAPPLDGIWASAPYFHNGSVPTLWHVLHPEKRPAVWKRTENGYDQQRVGLEISEFSDLPNSVTRNADRRRYFDTIKPGKSSRGHTFPDQLTEDEKRAVLEYLKTL